MSTIIVSSLLITIFFLCLSLHACNARHLGVFMDDKNASHKKHHFSAKVLESVRQLKEDETISVDEEGMSGGDRNIFHESHDVKPKDSEKLLKETKQNRRISSAVSVPMKPLVSVSGGVPRKNLDENRTVTFKPCTHLGFLRATSIEGSRRRGLSRVVVEHEHGSQPLGKRERDPYKAHHYHLEDSSLADYDPPRQEPPIHNRQTWMYNI